MICVPIPIPLCLCSCTYTPKLKLNSVYLMVFAIRNYLYVNGGIYRALATIQVWGKNNRKSHVHFYFQNIFGFVSDWETLSDLN